MDIKGRQLIDILQKRYAVKHFDPTGKISSNEENTIKQTLLLSASSYGLQPYQFVFIKNEALRKRLRAASFDQSQITDSSFLIAFCIRTDIDEAYIKRYIEHSSYITGRPLEELKHYQEKMLEKMLAKDQQEREVWAMKQVYIALGNAITCVAALGIDACPMEGFIPDRYDEILGHEKRHLKTVVLMAVGRSIEDDPTAKRKKVRQTPEDLFLEI